MILIKTNRLELTAATIELSEAELSNRAQFSKLLNAEIPEDWPPESAIDALPFFLEVLRKFPGWTGWLTWYAVLTAKRTLVGGIGFKGAPDKNGMIEIGYSVLPKYQKLGIATEMVNELCYWAFKQDVVACIEAETAIDNIGSIKVLKKAGFKEIGSGIEEKSLRFRLER